MDLCVVLGKHEVMCEFAGEPKLAALLATVGKALCGVGMELTPSSKLKLMPEGLLLSDDSSVAALSSGSTIEVIPSDRDVAIRILKDKGVCLDRYADLRQALEGGDTETVRLLLVAWGDSAIYTGFIKQAIRDVAVCGNLRMFRAMLSERTCVSLAGTCWWGWSPPHHLDNFQARDFVQVLVEHGITYETITHAGFFDRAAQMGCDWVFTALTPHPAVLHSALLKAVEANSLPTVRAIASRNTLHQPWLSDALSSEVDAASSDRTDMCRLLVELGAEVPRNASLDDATCLGFFDVLVEHGADVEDGCANGEPTPLLAAKCPHKQQALIKLGANVNARDRDGFHILMRGRADLDVMSLAIAHGADVNAADSTGMTCLMYMCAQGKCPPVALLLDHGAELEATDAEGATALWYADTKEVLTLLVQRGAAINSHDAKGDWFLHYQSRAVHEESGWRWEQHEYSRNRMMKRHERYTEMLKVLVAQPHLDVNVVDSTGGTVLMRAAQSDHSIAFLLARADIDVGAQDNFGTCLMHAASTKSLVPCKEILAHLKEAKRTTDVTIRDCNGWTCLMHAVSGANCDIFPRPEEADKVRAELVVALVAHGADPSARNDDGLTALRIAVASNSGDAFAALLAAGAFPDTCSSEGVSLLHMVVSKSLTFFEALVALPGIDMNVRDNMGRTVLMRVSRSSGVARCTALLQKGADVGAQDNDGRTCLGHAAASGDAKVVTLLLDHGAGINDGAVPPLLAAVLASSAPVCRVLLERGADVKKPAADGRTCVSVAAGLRCRGAKAVMALVHEALGVGDDDDEPDSADSTQGAAGEAPANGSSKRKRDDDDEHPASTHACAVCGAAALASGEPFPSAESVLRHASSKHRMRRSEYTRRFGE